ncbi:hypothetical protein ONZ51_g12025 [Trametes cubensis]|uniref:Uncharacterized protein n=1 Tax=Trametes cubensis TaxID=1111947 RepID=A0AAD7TJ23_9APHY|nr:hypothetical protein ONZ51_g12025 [Trametes cubensis]
MPEDPRSGLRLRRGSGLARGHPGPHPAQGGGRKPYSQEGQVRPRVDDDEVTEVPAPAGPWTPEKPQADKGKGKEKAAEKPLKPAVARGSLTNSGAAASGSRLPELARTRAWWSRDPELLSDRELLKHLLVTVQRNQQTSVRVVDLLVDEEEQHEELLEEECQVLTDLVVKIVWDKLQSSIAHAVRDAVKSELEAEFGRMMRSWGRRWRGIAEEETEEEGSGDESEQDKSEGKAQRMEARGTKSHGSRKEGRSPAVEEEQVGSEVEDDQEMGKGPEEAPEQMDTA